MKRYIPLLIAAIVTIIIAAAVLFTHFTTPNERLKTPQERDSVTDGPPIALKDTEFFLFGTKDVKSCQIHAKESNVYPNKRKTECLEITCQLTTTNNNIATLKAPSAHIDHERKQITLPGTVSGDFKGWKLTEKDAFYDARSQIIAGKETKITQNNHISITSTRSKLDLKNETIALEGGVVSCFEK